MSQSTFEMLRLTHTRTHTHMDPIFTHNFKQISIYINVINSLTLTFIYAQYPYMDNFLLCAPIWCFFFKFNLELMRWWLFDYLIWKICAYHAFWPPNMKKNSVYGFFDVSKFLAYFYGPFLKFVFFFVRH